MTSEKENRTQRGKWKTTELSKGFGIAAVGIILIAAAVAGANFALNNYLEVKYFLLSRLTSFDVF